MEETIEVGQEQIDKWKDEHGRVMKLTINKEDWYYRSIRIDEYLNIQRLIEIDSNAQGEEELVRVGLLHPELPKKPGAGLVFTLSEEILRISGFTQDSVPQEL